MSDLKKFQELIGYTFKNEQLLKQALTHSSYANEKHLKKLSDNERLEFLGDAVLEVVSSEFLFTNYQNLTEGQLTKFRASIVCEPTLAACTESIHLGEFLFCQSILPLQMSYHGQDQSHLIEHKSIAHDLPALLLAG